MHSKKIFTATKDTATGTNVEVAGVVRNAFTVEGRGAAFSLQLVNVGVETGGKTVTATYQIKMHPSAPWHTPANALDICTSYDCDAAAALETDSWGFSPPACHAVRVVLTFSGAITNGLDGYLCIA